MVAKQTEKPRIKSMLLEIRSKVKEGFSLADSLTQFPYAFPELYRATVRAGEHSGHLDLVLEQLADYTEQSSDTQKKIKGALIYPVVITIFSIGIVVLLLNFVIPKMVTVFENSSQELPALTAGDRASDFCRPGFVLLLGIAVAVETGPESAELRRKVHLMLLRAVGGEIIRGMIQRGWQAR